ncbi:hypothetical protein JW935_19615, partial [candidate division KSB1 bacterium]|nr:hypothetical protein [candidate division KSB1 bacterium]
MFKILCCLFIIHCYTVSIVFAADADCITPNGGSGVASVPKIGTVHAVVIYACGTNAGSKLLPSWYDDICSSADDASIPSYYDDISFGNHTLTMTPFGKTEDSCFVADIAYTMSSTWVVSSAFYNDIMIKADSVIDFSDYDNDGPDGTANSGDDDGYVDYLFFVVVNHDGGNGIEAGYSYTTADSQYGGGYIQVNSTKCSMNRVGSRLAADQVLTHEYCHEFGVLDLDHSGAAEYDHYATGGFGLMVNDNGFEQKQGTINPWFRMSGSHANKFGWIIPIDVSTLLDQDILDMQTEEELYKLASSSATEYFLVSNHQKLSAWEDYWPGNGLLIWHIREASSMNDRRRKKIDIEAAHGLYNWSFTPDTTRGTANAESGLDSLDIRGIYPSDERHNGSASCLFNGETTQHFYHASNPSSKFYNTSTPYAQQQDSHIAVTNIHKDAGDPNIIIADLFTNYWSGTVSSNTTWSSSDGPFYVGGDLTVATGVTLTIQSGVTVNFLNGDDQSGGLNTSKSEIIVNGTLQADGVTFTASSIGDWYGIIFNSTASSTSYLDNCTIVNANRAVEILNSDPLVEECDISNCQYGIYVNGSSANPTVTKCEIDNITYYALIDYNGADGDYYDNKLSATRDPIRIYNGDSHFWANDILHSTDYNGVIIYGSSTCANLGSENGETNGNYFDSDVDDDVVHISAGTPNFGYYSEAYNHFEGVGGSGYYIDNNTGSTINAHDCYWNDGTQPSSSEFDGSVSTTSWESTPPNAGTTWKRIPDEGNGSNPFAEGLQSYYARNYAAAATQIKNAFETNSHHEMAHFALARYFSACTKTETFPVDFCCKIFTGDYNPSVVQVARTWLIRYYSLNHQMQKAEQVAFTAPKSSDFERVVLLDLIYYYSINDESQSVERV